MPIYHALSVKQPWANLICTGRKTIETRIWRTSYRGELLLCAGLQPAIDPCGCAICLVALVACRPMQTEDWAAACIAPYTTSPFAREDRSTSAPQIVYGWHLANIRPVPPLPVRGRLRIFRVTLPDLLSQQ